MPADFYDLLDVGSEASPEAIRRAYREKAREYHPDVNPDARSSDQFKAIRTAYEVLSDASERKDYDRMGHRAYVDARLDGLPRASGGGSAKSSGQPSGGSGSGRGNRRTRQSGTARSSTTTGSGGRARSTAQGSGGSSKNRSNWGERTISEPGARARAMRAGDRIGVEPVLALAIVGYLAGLALLLTASSTVLGTVVEALSTGDTESLLTVLETPGFADPLSFVSAAIDEPSPTLLFPLGTVGFPLVLAVHATRTNRAFWWVPVGFALGPLVGLGLAAGGILATVAVDLALFVLLPALAVLATAAAWLRS